MVKKILVVDDDFEDLTRTAQEERFNENKISGLIYNVRIRKYNEKLENLKQELPVLESRLKELQKGK